MKKTKLTRSLLAAVSIVALTAVMYGCTHDSDDPPATDGMEMETPADQIAALQEQINTLRAELGLDPIDIDALTGSVADLTQQVADLQQQIDDAQDEKDKAADEAAAKDAMALFTGIGDATNLSVTIAATGAVTDEDGGGGMASVAAGRLTPGVGMHDDLMKSAEPMLGMWQGTMLTRAVPDDADTNPGTSSTVVVYTDIAAPKAVPFAEVYGSDVLTIDADADADPHVKLISASEFSSSGMMVHDPDPGESDDVIRIRGMFNGASGEYRCTESGTTGVCTSHASSMGVRLSTGWTFDPDSGSMAMQVDASYAYFGWWLNKGTTEGVEAGVFHGVTDGSTPPALAAPTAIGPLGSTATYSGSAAGKYAISPGLSTASGGHWTADATLTADFGNETDPGTISGMVDNFMAGGETMGWSVALGETALGADGTFSSATGDPATGDGVVWTIGGVAGMESGSWSGGLRAAGDNGVPTLATGMFSATHGTVGHLVGAFGAHLDE